jgi:hypothetical protein
MAKILYSARKMLVVANKELGRVLNVDRKQRRLGVFDFTPPLFET